MLLERDQLSDRINKLSAFIERYNNPQDALPENAPSGYELGLMSDQLEHMLQYLFVLNQRIGASIKHSPCKVAAAAGLIRDPEPDPIPEPEQFDQPETPES